MPKQVQARDPQLWAAAQQAFESAHAGCYVPAPTEKRETERAYRKLVALKNKQKKKSPGH